MRSYRSFPVGEEIRFERKHMDLLRRASSNRLCLSVRCTAAIDLKIVAVQNDVKLLFE